MSLFRGYFVPEGVDPTGKTCAADEVLVLATCTYTSLCQKGGFCGYGARVEETELKPQLKTYCAKKDAAGNPIFTPNAVCNDRRPANYWRPWGYCHFATTNATNGGDSPWETECDQKMVEWLSGAGADGDGPGSVAHANCIEWCSTCVANKLATDTISRGVLAKACIDNLCGPSFPGK